MSKNKINIGNVEMVSVSDGNGDREPTFVFPDSEIEILPTKEGKLIPRLKAKAHQRKPSDGDQNSNLEKLPPFIS